MNVLIITPCPLINLVYERIEEVNFAYEMFLKITFLPIFFLSSLPSNSQDINKIIDDFTDNPERRRQVYIEQVMGGVSEGMASVRL